MMPRAVVLSKFFKLLVNSAYKVESPDDFGGLNATSMLVIFLHTIMMNI